MVLKGSNNLFKQNLPNKLKKYESSSGAGIECLTIIEKCVIRADCQEKAVCTLCCSICAWTSRRDKCASIEGGFNEVIFPFSI